jgi:signal transduction histidine kinase
MLRWFLIQLIIVPVVSLQLAAASPTAIKGVMDLRQISNNEKFILKLNGEWEFYWKKMLHPEDFALSAIKPDYYGRVPSYWTDYNQDSVKTTQYGYATYRLTILLPHEFRAPLAFDIPVFDSSYELYINGKLSGSNGKPGKTAAETIPYYKRSFVQIAPESDTIELIINVANFHHRRGGFWLPAKLGTYQELQKQTTNLWAADWAITTILIGFAIFFLFFFILSPRDKVMIYISIATASLAIRPLFTSHFLILDFFNIDWNWIIRFEYLGLYGIILGWSWFIREIYPSKFIKLIVTGYSVIYSISLVLTLLLPVRIFSYITLFYYPSLLILIAYLLAKSLTGALKRNYIDLMYFATFCILLFGGIHDIRVASGKADSSSGYLLSYLIVVFIFSQAGLFFYKWIRAFNETEKLQKKMAFMNRNLEILVNQRTQELKTRTEEIEAQNFRIAFQNKQLSDTISLKNRIFALIAHDLRSPIVNILYMLNLLKEKEYKEKYDEFANSSIQYAQLVISLLENMLVWGRGQEDRIKFSPEKRDLADIILTNLSIFKESADNKDISVTFTQGGSSIAYFDKDLLDIIIRNLLSNALKYTPRGGRIGIMLKEKVGLNEGMMLKICDNGVGISETRIKNLFTSAEIESTPGTEMEKGTGFGLKLCNDLVRLNNGTITVESKEGEGTCIIIALPVDQTTATIQSAGSDTV